MPDTASLQSSHHIVLVIFGRERYVIVAFNNGIRLVSIEFLIRWWWWLWLWAAVLEKFISQFFFKFVFIDRYVTD